MSGYCTIATYFEGLDKNRLVRIPEMHELQQVHEACNGNTDMGKPDREQVELHP
jgi:hypothetical protein